MAVAGGEIAFYKVCVILNTTANMDHTFKKLSGTMGDEMVSRRNFFWLATGLLGTLILPRKARTDSTSQNGSCVQSFEKKSGRQVSSQNLSQDAYPLTIEALKAEYRDEIQSFHLYSAYAETAAVDELPGVAHLFRAFSECEFITARNFNNILLDLNVQYHVPISQAQVNSTKDNLRAAIQWELTEIEQHYPKLLDRIKPEGHINAMAATQHAFEARKQHYKLLLDMKNAMGFFYSMMVDRIEKDRLQFFICGICGSVAIELPQRTCCICENPAYFYKEIPSPL